uniref:nitroreductase/quinone reductase family protein n=1 Tax=Nonomuraea pusilla TaxID=46177 RepID=UPI000AB16F17|nr:nitroreductase/quinone reductase family protein [Nonomuraea pusilla]
MSRRENTFMPHDFQQQIIDEFRAGKGRVGGPFEGARLLLLTTTGARTGRPHTTPLGYLPDGGGRMLVIASAGGSPKHPAWYHNLVANPRVTVETGAFTLEADATVLQGEERDAIFARAVESDPGWAEYEAKSGRVLPVVALTPVASPVAGMRGGDALTAIHDAFRKELALVRAEVARSGPAIGAQLRVNCLTLCAGLHHHHSGESGGLFPRLRLDHPELAPALDRLEEEHQEVARLLDDLQRALDSGSPDLAAEVDRLATAIEAHLDYEELHLVPALNGDAGPR